MRTAADDNETGSPYQREEDFATELFSLLKILWARVRRHRTVGGLFGVLAILPVVAYGLFAVPIYSTSGSILVESGGSSAGTAQILNLAVGGLTGNETVTEVEIIKRRSFLLRSLKSLNLHIIDPNENVKFTDDLAVSLGRESPQSDAIRRLRKAIELAELGDHTFEPVDITINTNISGALEVSVNGQREVISPGIETAIGPVRLSFRTTDILDEGQEIVVQMLPDEVTFRRYRDHIQVFRVGTAREPTAIVRILASHSDRTTAQLIVNRMIELYVQESLEWQSQSASQASSFIATQLEEIRETLSRHESRYREFAKDEDALALEIQVEQAIENIASLEAQKMDIRLRVRTIDEIESSLRSRTRKGKKADLTANFILNDPVLNEAIATLTALETEYETMTSGFAPAHPRVTSLSRKLELQRRQIQSLLRGARNSLAAAGTEIGAEIAEATESLSVFPDKQLKLAEITRDVDVSKALYSLLLEKYEEAEIIRASTTTDKRVLEFAPIPAKPTAPSRSLLAVFGFVVAIIVGSLAILVAAIKDQDLSSISQIEQLTDIPIFGVVYLPESTPGNPPPPLTRDAIWTDQATPNSESFRSMAVNLTLTPLGPADRGKMISVTSSQPGEGKSTVLSNLAIALTKAGKKVAIVDLDLRRPTQHRIWNKSRGPGFTDAIANLDLSSPGSNLGEFHRIDNIEIMTAGTRIPDPSAVLLADRPKQFFEHLRQRFDYILIDSVPAFVNDSRPISNLVDIVLFITRLNVAQRTGLASALKTIKRETAHKTVLVANGVPINKATSGYEYYGLGSYEYYSQEPSESGERPPPSGGLT